MHEAWPLLPRHLPSGRKDKKCVQMTIYIWITGNDYADPKEGRQERRHRGRTVIGLEFNFFKLSFPFYNSLVFFN